MTVIPRDERAEDGERHGPRHRPEPASPRAREREDRHAGEDDATVEHRRARLAHGQYTRRRSYSRRVPGSAISRKTFSMSRSRRRRSSRSRARRWSRLRGCPALHEDERDEQRGGRIVTATIVAAHPEFDEGEEQDDATSTDAPRGLTSPCVVLASAPCGRGTVPSFTPRGRTWLFTRRSGGGRGERGVCPLAFAESTDGGHDCRVRRPLTRRAAGDDRSRPRDLAHAHRCRRRSSARRRRRPASRPMPANVGATPARARDTAAWRCRWRPHLRDSSKGEARCAAE